MSTSKWIKGIISVVLLVILYFQLDSKILWQTLKSIEPTIIIYVIMIYIIIFLVSALNMKTLVSPYIKLQLSKAVHYFCIGWAMGLFLPGKIGSMTNIYFLKKEGLKLGEASALFLVDKIIAFVIIAAIGGVGAYLLDWMVVAEIIIFLIACVIIGILVVNSRKFKGVIPKKIKMKFKGFNECIKNLWQNHKQIILINIILTSIQWFLAFLALYLIFIHLEASTSLFNVIVINSIVKLVSLIPISLSGLGIREITAVYFFGLVGISTETTVAVYAIGLIIFYSIGFLTLIIEKKEYDNLINNVNNWRKKRHNR